MAEDPRIEQMKKDLINKVGCVSDFREYFAQIADLEEHYDETIEYYDWLTWQSGAGDKRIEKATELLRVTAQVMEEIVETAEEELYRMVLDIAKLSGETQQAIWSITLDAEALSEEDFRDRLIDMEYQYNQSNAYEEFLNVLKTFGAVEG